MVSNWRVEADGEETQVQLKLLPEQLPPHLPPVHII